MGPARTIDRSSSNGVIGPLTWTGIRYSVSQSVPLGSETHPVAFDQPSTTLSYAPALPTPV